MGETTGIQWTSATWNPWQGCRKKSPGCKNGYMYRDKARYGQDPRFVVRSSAATFDKPLRWQREVEQGKRTADDRLIFTCSWSDWFEPEADAWRHEAWEIIRQCPDLIFQILTKNADRIADHLPTTWGYGWPNVWLGVSVENQEWADRRIPTLLEIPAKVRFLSIEPLLGPVELWSLRCGHLFDGEGAPYYNALRGSLWWGGTGEHGCNGPAINWVIVGGESGPDARPCDLAWIRSIRDQCREASVPCFIKQLGAVAHGMWDLADDPDSIESYGRRVLRDSHGGDWDEWPKDLRVREMPRV